MHNERCTSGSEGGLEKPGGRKADRALRSDPTLKPLENRDKSEPQAAMKRAFPTLQNALALVVVLIVAAGIGPARADGASPAGSPDADAARLVEEVLQAAGGNGQESLGDWTRGVIERALGRAGETARQTVPGRSGEAPPLPAERHAGRLAGTAAGRPGTAEVLIFTSLSVPAESWRQWASEAARIGVPLVLRGVGEGGLRETVKQIGARLGGAEAGVAIDPRLFRLFGVTRVPAVAVVPGGVPPCSSRGCADDPAPPHDLVTGNIGLAAALQAVAEEGDAGRSVAQDRLERLRGNDRP